MVTFLQNAMTFLRARKLGLLAGFAGVTVVIAFAALGSRPSDVRTPSIKARTTNQSSATETVGTEPSEVAAGEPQPSPGATGKPTARKAVKKSAVTTGSGAAPLVGGLGRGVTADKIKLGFIIVENNQKMLSFYGVQGGATGDTKQQVNAVVNDLNARGGILGRKIEPVFRTLDSTDTTDQFPSFCAAFSQDEKVFAVLSPWNSNAAFHACLAKAGTLYITDALDQEDQETFQEFKPYLVSGMMTSSRGAVSLARALNQAGFFAAGTKLGVIRINNPTGERVYNNHFKPTLASFDVIPADVTYSGLTTRAGVDAAQRFQGKGINRVAFITARGGPALGFMTAAQSMGYFPLYGIASPDSPAFLAQNAPYPQLRGAFGAGWAAGLDVFDREGPPRTPAEQRCFEVHAKAGTTYSARGGEDVGAYIALTFCDMLWLLEEAGTKAGRTLNVGSFATALGQLGTSHQTTATFGTTYSPTVYDGANQFRTLTYDDSPSCRCFKYTGPAQTVPR